MRRRFGIAGFIVIVQSILFLTHYFLYQTWTFSAPSAANFPVGLVLGVLSISFVVASLLAFRYTNPVVRTIYRAAAVWMGLLSFVFVAAVASWLILAVTKLASVPLRFHPLVEGLFAAALAIGIAGVINASWTRVTRATIRLANLPETWRGRKAALISDVHLGHVRNRNFLQRMVGKILNEDPDAIFIAGDLYDGTFIDAQKASPVIMNNLATTASI